MRRTVALASLALLPLTFASSADAQSERSSWARSSSGLRSFIGLWEGIDPVDGGDSLRSITCSWIGAARSP